MTTMPRAFGADYPANRLIISDETVLFNNNTGTWRRITSRSADSDEIFVTLANQGLSPAARPARGGGPQSRPRLPPARSTKPSPGPPN